MTTYSSHGHRRAHDGVALISVLYFLVVCGLAATALLAGERSRARNAFGTRNGARLMALADSALYAALADWAPSERLRQSVGTTVALSNTSSREVRTMVSITRTTRRLFSIVAESTDLGDGSSRRVSLFVRLPIAPSARGALVSAVDVAVGPDVIIVADTGCADSTAAAIMLAPSATLALDSSGRAAAPSMVHDSAAADSAMYLRFGGAWWSDVASVADVRLANGVHVTPMPVLGAGVCTRLDSNWGDPTSRTSVCAARVPVVYANGDLTIDGGLGQGALLVDGHLTIAGPFTFSGQIVARNGIEMLADDITISGSVYAWRASSDSLVARAHAARVVLARRTTLRAARCDAWHGMASWLQPRRVRNYAWTELF